MRVKAAILAVIFMLAGCRSSLLIAAYAAEIPDKKPRAELYIKETIQPEEVQITEGIEEDVEMDGSVLEELRNSISSFVCLGLLTSVRSDYYGEDKEGVVEDLHLDEEEADPEPEPEPEVEQELVE